mmetsp:Transcript_2026/g.5197  ORF Transcript_2026/g.5197 Transcript_2026/m.5197 type:complete len:200 (+) Transcript_2026:468-1067(+)
MRTGCKNSSGKSSYGMESAPSHGGSVAGILIRGIHAPASSWYAMEKCCSHSDSSSSLYSSMLAAHARLSTGSSSAGVRPSPNSSTACSQLNSEIVSKHCWIVRLRGRRSCAARREPADEQYTSCHVLLVMAWRHSSTRPSHPNACEHQSFMQSRSWPRVSPRSHNILAALSLLLLASEQNSCKLEVSCADSTLSSILPV